MASAAMTSHEAGAAEFHKVGAANALGGGARLHVSVEGRMITVLEHNGELYCLDSTCYHTGGPLGVGDIEEVNGQTCIVCPWHMYQVTLSGGAKMYESLVMGEGGKLVPGGWKQKEGAQRTHTVEKRADGIYVRLNLEGKRDSDMYGSLPTCGAQKNKAAAAAAASGGASDESGTCNKVKLHSKFPLRSGHVLNQPGGGVSQGLAGLTSSSSSSSSSFSATPVPTLQETAEHDSAVALGETLAWEALTVSQMAAEGSSGVRLELHTAGSETTGWLFNELFAKKRLATSRDVFYISAVQLAVPGPAGGYNTGEVVGRPFTPLLTPNRADPHAVQFAVRVYPGGKLTPELAKRAAGDVVEVAPFLRRRTAEAVAKLPPLAEIATVFLFAGGSGITPVLQVLQNLLDRADAAADKTINVVVVVANKSSDSALALDCLDKLALEASDKTPIAVHHLFTADQPDTRINQALLQKLGVAAKRRDQVYAWCGPPAFDNAVQQLLDAMQVLPDNCINF